MPNNINILFTDRVLAMFIMMDGSFDQGKRGFGRLNLHTNFFTLTEVKILQSILIEKYNINSYFSWLVF